MAGQSTGGRPAIGTIDGQEHGATAPAARPSPARRRAVYLFGAVFLALQLLIPLRQLGGPFIRPFGWQMYSALADHRYQVELIDGSAGEIDPADYVLRYRGEVDYQEVLPEVLCERIPGATEVRLTSRLAGIDERHRCDR